MSPYHEDHSVDKKQVEEWLKKASLNKINIYNNYNQIILRLCKALLKEWNNDDN